MAENIIIIPTYNEIENIGVLVTEIMISYNQFDIVIIDDNSSDGTRELINTLSIKYPGRVNVLNRKKKEGLGVAYKAGMKFALEKNYNYIFQMDADLSHQPQHLKDFLDISKTADMVIGSRYLHGISIVNWPLRRLFLSLFANRYVKFITGVKLTDFTSGFRCYKRELLRQIPLDRIMSNGYAFLVETVFRAYHLKATIKETPIIFIERRHGASKVNYPVILESMVIPLKLKIKQLMGKL